MIPLENLAMDLRDLGDYAGAKALAERSLAIAERAFGPKHPDVAGSLHTLATVVAGLGDYAEAMRLFERATRINEEALRPPNPEVPARRGSFPTCFRSPATARRMRTSSSECWRIAREPRTRRPAHGREPEQSGGLLSSADDYRRTRPLFERALRGAGEIPGTGSSGGRSRRQPISPRCCRGLATTTAARRSTSAP